MRREVFVRVNRRAISSNKTEGRFSQERLQVGGSVKNSHASRRWTGWAEVIAPEQWSVYRRVLQTAAESPIPFALGGAFATATHTGIWRGTNDMDLYILPQDRDRMIALVEHLELKDVQDSSPYDPSVTYRASDGNAIVELIWGMKNHRAYVDDLWLERAQEIEIEGIRVRLTALEEMIWPKLYVLSRERCDWPDILNMLHFCGASIDWRHLLARLHDDLPLLAGVVVLLRWLSPERLQQFPSWLMNRLGLDNGTELADPEVLRCRASLLNAKDWFGLPLTEQPAPEPTRD